MSLYVRHILESGVEVNTNFRFLYGLRLVGNTEVYRHLPEEVLRDLLSSTVPESRAYPNKYLFTVFYRTRTREGFYVNEVYFLSYDRFLVRSLQNSLGSNAVLMKGYELANALIRLQTLFDDIQLRDKKLMRQVRYFTEEDVFSPPVERTYREVVKQIEAKKRREGREKRVFAGARLGEADAINFEQVVSLPWTGVLWIMLDLNDLSFVLKKRAETIYPERAEWLEVREAYLSGKFPLVGNSVFLVTEDEEVDEYKLVLFSALGYIPVEKIVDRGTIISSTILTRRDMDYVHLITPEVACRYVPLTIERGYVPEEPMIYGRNRFGSYVAFSYFDTNESENPHAITLAPPGSGKSFSMQNEVVTTLGVDLPALLKGKEAPPLNPKFRIRYFDKGYSAELLFKLLSLRSYDVEIFSSRPSELRFNPCEIHDEEDYEFSAEMINAILEVMKLEPLTGEERLLFLKTLREVKENDRYKYYLSQHVSILKKRSPELYEKVRRAGFKDDDLMGEVVRSGKFENLAQPTVADVHRLVTNVNDPASESLARKLQNVSDVPMFSFVSEVDVKGSKLFYMDLELLAENPYFVPLLLGIMRRLFHHDKFYKSEDEYAIYLLDEVHQLFKVNAFYDALNTQVREARRFRIQIRYATQNPSDVPAKLILNMKTKIFLTPQDVTEREAFLSELMEHVNVEDRDADPFYVFRKCPRYYATVWYSRGAFSISLPVDEVKSMVFDSYRKSLETEDGYVLVKTTAPELAERLRREGRKVV